MAAPITNQFIDKISGSIQEILGKSMLVEVRVADPIFNDMVLGSIGLTPTGELGRDFRYRKRYHRDAGGVIRGGNLNDYALGMYGEVNAATPGGAVRTGILGGTGKGPNFAQLQTISKVWPDPTNGLAPDQFGIAFDLYSFETNLMLSLSEMAMENVPAAVRDFIAPKLRGQGKRISQFFATSFYENSNNVLGTFPSTVAGSDIDSTNQLVTFQPVEKTTHRFMVGMEVDVWPTGGPSTAGINGRRLNQRNDAGAADANNADEASRVRCFVANVDDVAGKVTLWVDTTYAGSGSFTFGGAAGGNGFTTSANSLPSAFVTPANTYGGTTPVFAKFFGWRDFFKWGATSAAADNVILGSNAITGATKYDFIDIRSNADFKSFHKSISGPMTNELLAQYLESIDVAFRRTGDTIDTLIACRGLWRNMVEAETIKEKMEVNGKPSSQQGRGSIVGESFVVDGKVYKKRTSDYLEDGYMLGVNNSANFQLAVPPDPDMVKKGGLPELPDKLPFRFVMPALTGGQMTRFPILRVNAGGNAMPTEATMMPGQVRAQIFPARQIRGVVFDGITTSRVFGD